MGKRVALTAVLSTLVVLALASSASAAWTHKGKGELKENASIALKGTVTLTTSAGNVACPTEIGGTLTASGSSGHISSFTVSKPSECDLTGSLAAICGTHGLTKVEKTGTWALTADETDITISAIDVHYVMAGCLIPSFRLKGNSTASLDKTTAIGKATLSGTQTLYNSMGEESGTGELKGTLTASPAGTYGVKTGSLVETVWTDEDAHLGSDGKLTLSGSFSFSGSDGSIDCPATIKLLLESSTVEEEEAEGEIESFAVSSPGGCHVSGGYAATCSTNSVTKIEQTGTATLTATKEDIKVSGLVLDYELKECGITSLRVEGSPTLTPDDPESIGTATFSGAALEVFNSKGETTDIASAGGSGSASPSGTYQLVPIDLVHKEETEIAETEETEETAHTAHTEETAETGDLWYHDPGEEQIGEATGNEYIFTGALSSYRVVENGPCEVEASVDLWNEEGAPTGEVTGFTASAPCGPVRTGSPTSGTVLPGCLIEEVQVEGLPWHIDVETGATGIEITDFEFAYVYGGCQTFGIPSGVPIWTHGDATGTWVNGENGGCIVFNHDGDMTSGGGNPVTLNGSICAEGPTLK